MIFEGGTNSQKSHQIEMERGMLDRKPTWCFFWGDPKFFEPGPGAKTATCAAKPGAAHTQRRGEGSWLPALRQLVLNDIVYVWLTFKAHLFKSKSSMVKIPTLMSFWEFPKKTEMLWEFFPSPIGWPSQAIVAFGCRTLQRCGRFSLPESWPIVLTTNRNRS